MEENKSGFKIDYSVCKNSSGGSITGGSCQFSKTTPAPRGKLVARGQNYE